MSAGQQPDLFTRPPRPFASDAFGQDAASGSRERRPYVAALLPRLLTSLDGRGWVCARVLARELGVNDRSIREAANKSCGRVLGGQRGYCLTMEASIEDVQAITRWLLSQSARMRERVIEIEHVYHRKGAA